MQIRFGTSMLYTMANRFGNQRLLNKRVADFLTKGFPLISPEDRPLIRRHRQQWQAFLEENPDYLRLMQKKVEADPERGNGLNEVEQARFDEMNAKIPDRLRPGILFAYAQHVLGSKLAHTSD